MTIERTTHSQGRISSPLLGFAVVVIGAFLAEGLIMTILPTLQLRNLWVEDLLDAAFLSISVSILSYFLTVRPLIVSSKALGLSEDRLRSIFDLSVIGIAVADKDGLLNETNPAFQRMLGYSGAELAGMSWEQITHPDDIGHSATVISEIATGQRTGSRVEKRYLRKDGATVWGKDHISVARDHNGEVRFFTILVEDISIIREAEREQRLAAALFQTSAEAMIITDAENNIIKANPSFTKVTGYSEAEVVGQNPRILTSGYHSQEFYSQLWTELMRDGHWRGDLWNRHKDGHIYAQRVTISLIRDEQGTIANHVSVFSDVTEEKRETDRILHQAQYDALTGLPNRALLWERLLMAFPRIVEYQLDLALLFIDLDGFKPVNDQYGHPIGDQLLQTIAERLKQCVRHSDTVARMGGDEFVILSLDRNSHIAAQRIADKVLSTLHDAILIDGHDLTISASIGVAIFPNDGTDPKALLAAADAAMYKAKQAGKDRVHFHGGNISRSVAAI